MVADSGDHSIVATHDVESFAKRFYFVAVSGTVVEIVDSHGIEVNAFFGGSARDALHGPVIVCRKTVGEVIFGCNVFFLP